jgi:ATP-dependent DNA helicase DinG
MDLDCDSLLELLEPKGRLSGFLSDYECRRQQQEMMKAVALAFNVKNISLIEAGTGTGKSLAYLIPAVVKAVNDNQPVVIATKTINLQQQLIEKDIPLVAKVLGFKFKYALVKGMGNYVCMRKLEDTEYELDCLPRNESEQLRNIRAWAGSTSTGSKSELSFNPYSSVWEKVNCEADTCTYRRCPHYDRCHFFKAREEAKDAKILVANHHILFADLAMRASDDNYDDAAILPHYRHVIVDEAHHIEDVATEFFAEHVSRTDLMKTMGKISSEKTGSDSGRVPLLKKKLLAAYKQAPKDQFDKLSTLFNVSLPFRRREVIQAIADFFQTLTHFFNDKQTNREEENKLRLYNRHAGESFWLEEVRPRADALLRAVKSYVHSLRTLCREIKEIDHQPLQEQAAGLMTELAAYADRLDEKTNVIEKCVFEEVKDDSVRWLETSFVKTMQNIRLIEAKLDVSPYLVENFFTKFETIVFCSATLTTNRNFNYIKERLGLSCDRLSHRSVEEHIFQSPFDYQKQSLLLVPSILPSPQRHDYIEKASETILRAVKASHGNAFVLFTSYAMLKECFQKLSPKLRKLRFAVMKQGDDQRQTLLTNFRNTDRSVLFATDSFWEGVDVSGESLRLVILVKLPFRVPSEPIFQARSELITAKSGDPFREYALPSAIVKFKQGFGRLIRHKHDRGIVLVLDNRLMTKGYGKLFLRSLPECPHVFSEDPAKEMEAFYKRTYPLVLSRNCN